MGAMDAVARGAQQYGSGQGNAVIKQQTITIHDTPSPTAVITISDSEDESPQESKRNIVQATGSATGGNNASASSSSVSTASGNNGK